MDGTHSGLSMVCAVAAACRRAQLDKLSQTMLMLRDSGNTAKGLVISRHYDCTPWSVSFNQLAEQLTPHARYVVKQEAADGSNFGYMHDSRICRSQTKIPTIV